MKKIHVVISESDDDAISDANTHNWYMGLSDGDTARVATAQMFSELRVAARLKEIELFSFSYKGKDYHIDEQGHILPCWPENLFGDLVWHMDVVMEGISREEAKKSAM
ncbi:hypothetical protein ABJY94_18350 [Vibrio parahaemolyticus]|uniref:hypothetical protein n=1 Tax=Vibrio parahaemolyticus TaxID=670 RepID=UPI0032AEAEE9